MSGRLVKLVPAFVARDVDRVRRNAAIVFELDTNHVRVKRNPKAGLSIIAVIGPSEYQGTRYRSALLCEIGIRRGRPYTAALGHPRRRKWFTLTETQYRLVAPLLFETLEQIAIDRVNSWSSPTFSVKTPRVWRSRRQKKTFYSEKNKEHPRGIRFTVDRRDRFLTADVLYAELNSRHVKRAMDGLARFVQILVGHYKTTSIHRKNFWRLKLASEALTAISSSRLSRHLKIQMVLDHFPRHALLRERMSEAVGWDDEELPWQLHEAGTVLPGSDRRVDGITLHVVRCDENRSRIVVEVYPKDIVELVWPVQKKEKRHARRH